MNFDVGKNHHASIVADILHIKFTDLLILNLGMNKIETVENLPRLMMPKLEEIYLCKNLLKKGGNHITKIKSLRRFTDNLKEFSLCK